MARSSPLARLTMGLALATFAGVAKGGDAPDPAGVEFFETKVRPILAARCLSCHGPAKTKGGLRLDARDSILKGGETGPAAVPGLPGESLVIEAVNYGETVQMPPKSRLPADEVATLTRWVKMGLPWPVESKASSSTTKSGFDLQARKASHWAWQPVRPRPVPEVKGREWPLGPIDRFLLASLEAKGLTPAPEAEKRALIRRLSFDLTGLPPTPEEVDAFQADPAPDAYDRLVDRLLASPRFGERWGRHWLDLVRYAETRGHEFDPEIPNAWQYRDYVTRALNADVPYDAFLTEHIAGDLVQPPRTDPATGGNESVLGTGFWFLGEEVHSPVDIRQDETDRLDNRLDVMTKTFLGLTVACARCHDHKFDAISQRDYYALGGFLISGSYRQVRFQTLDRDRQAAADLERLHDEARARLLPLAAAASRPGVDRLAETLLDACRPPSASSSDRLRLWSAELARARGDRSHPFHAFAALALDPACSDPKAFASALATLNNVPPPRALKGASKVVIDFGSTADLARAQDGFAYGLRPAGIGDLRVEIEKGKLRLGVFDRPAAYRDGLWGMLATLPVDQRDQGRLGTWDRSGQTIRTPEFTIGSGRLWYLVRGSGRAYAAVNSHLIIAGPLHGAILTEWEDPKRGWHWVRHDLTAYKGHRAHVEFSGGAGGYAAVATVVDADEEPLRTESPGPLLARALALGPINSVEGLATRYQAVLGAVRDGMEANDSDGLTRTAEGAALVDWVLWRDDLFQTAGSTERLALDRELDRFNVARAAIGRRLAAKPATAPAMLDGNGVDEHLLIRGSSKSPGPHVPRRFLEAIAGDRPIVSEGSGRLELAREMAAPGNPFTSRVMVNRVWHHLFGRGLVGSVDNFGVMGDLPSHPDLLDYLADTFAREGWSVKGLVREVVLSRAYRMSSKPSAQEVKDPRNLLLSRANLRRLESEPIRDAILAASGQLDARMFGPSVPVYLTEYMQGRGRPDASGPLDGDGRRSLYLETRRNFLSPMMLAFDTPTPFTTIGRRNVSNVPAQALILLNDPFVTGQAALWAKRALRDETKTAEERVTSLYRTAFARRPEAKEVKEALAFLKSQGEELGLPQNAWRTDPLAWADLAHVLINSKEFVFLD